MLKILTLNLNYDHAGAGTWSQRQARIETLLQEERPNIVALQAVHVSPQLDQVEALTRGYPYRHKLFMAASESLPYQGSAILADVPLSAPWSYALPHRKDDEDPSFRRAIGATFAWHGEVWQFTNAHCSWVAPQNLRQITALEGALQVFPGPQCLVGDFNATPDGPGIQHLVQAGWTDSFEVAGRGPGTTFPAPNPHSRIDYIFLSGVDPRRLLDIRVVPEAGEPLSDHQALILTLSR